MIWIADDVGSKELEPYFKPYDIPVERMDMDFADFAFWGEGIDGQSFIGVERKTIGFYTTEDGSGRLGGDFVASMRSKRLSGHQLKGLFDTYDYVFFLLEGIWKCGEQGEIIVPAGRNNWIPLRQGNRPVMYREVMGHLMTLRFVCGGYAERTGGPAETAAWIVALYKWFQKPFAEHNSHLGIYAPEPVRQRGRRGSFTFMPVSDVAKVAAQMPGIGDQKAFAFDKVFSSIDDLFLSLSTGDGRILKVEGIGKKGADRIYKWLRGQQQ